MKSANNKSQKLDKESLNYAMFEILAEYKRKGMSKADVLKAMLAFNPWCTIKEIIRRKNVAKNDIERWALRNLYKISRGSI